MTNQEKNNTYSLTLNKQDLEEASIKDLSNLVECVRAIATAISGISQQPRFADDNNFTKAGLILDDLTTYCDIVVESSMMAIEKKTPENEEEAERKLYAIISDRSILGYSFPQILGQISKGMIEINDFKSKAECEVWL